MAEKSTEEKLASRLPIWAPKDPDSGNYELLTPIAKGLDDLSDDVDNVGLAAVPQNAQTIDQIERLAVMVDVLPFKDEALEHYRARVIAEYQLVTSEGTVSDLLDGLATILETPPKNFEYSEPHDSTHGYGSCIVTVPLNSLDKSALSDSEIADIADDLVAVSYNVDIITKGTFTYISTSDYNNSLHDASKAYDGLDTNGDPKNNGGTYAGLIE
ncbi:hypothetical protein ACFQL7_20810 [Halocatena marina]|uniref:Baseplate protein J-like domain-containing protein n=1 Tax=Halocatena marina TaxID=2934937 RepID=A0ABD5YWX1_9EURY|nr:hypothetical protein [Halocatena marina]